KIPLVARTYPTPMAETRCQASLYPTAGNSA
ncbi:unnamed protein product, partial [marine sediment metagenome]